MTPPHHCPSEWRWAQYQMGMLSKEEAASFVSHIEECPDCRRRRKDRVEHESYLAQRDPWDALLANHQQATTEVVPEGWLVRWQRWFTSFVGAHSQHLAWGGAVALLPLLLVVHSLLPSSAPVRRGQPGVSRSGQATPSPLQRVGGMSGTAKSKRPSWRMLHYHLNSRISQWTPQGATLYPGDLVQFDYELPRALHVMVVSISHNGAISAYIPLGGQHSRKFTKHKGTYPAKRSLELDETLGFERIYMVSHDAPFAKRQLAKAILRAYQKAGKRLERMGALQGPWFVQSILIQKRARPQQKER